MKAFKHSSIQAFLAFFFFIFMFFSSAAQWSGNMESHTYHLGTVGIGSKETHLGRLEIYRVEPKEPSTGGGLTPTLELPHIHLTTYSEADQKIREWSLNGSGALTFRKDGKFVLAVKSSGLTVRGQNLNVGSFWLGKNQVSPNNSLSSYLAFSLQPKYNGWGSSSQKGAVMQVASDGSFYFYAKPNNGTTIHAGSLAQMNTFTIKSDGKIGIGTLDPTQLVTLSDLGSIGIRLESQDHPDWEIYTNNGLRFRGGQDGAGDELADRMVIGEDGRILVNVDPSANFPDVSGSSQDYKLFVNGGIAGKEVKVRTDWADYVFNKDYEVLPLNKVEAFIKINHHLPNMPSAEKVQAQGIELGDMTTKQQEKIEELFLHMIELEKRIAMLEKENQLLKSQK